MRYFPHIAAAICMLLASWNCHAFDPGSGANDNVWDIVLQPDQKIIVGGYFTEIDGVPRNRIARLNSDGSVDASFDTIIGANGPVRAMALQPNGKILIAGEFTEVDNVSRNHIARLNVNGSLDQSFDPGSGANGSINTRVSIDALALQPDGKVLIGGFFFEVNSISRSGIARLNADGSVDETFEPDVGADSRFGDIALQPDGKMLLSGIYTETPENAFSNIVRLNTNGSLDETFSSYSDPDVDILTLALQPDGRVLIGGFTLSSPFEGRLERVNADGSVDQTFNSGLGQSYGFIIDMALQPDGKVAIVGDFESGIARLNSDGSIDQAFDPRNEANIFPGFAVALQPDGKLLIGGFFIEIDGIPLRGIARLNADGSLDKSENLCFPVKASNGNIAMVCL